MPVALNPPFRIQDQQDFGSTPGAGNSGYAITWNNATLRFVLSSVAAPVSSVFGRTGAVVAVSGDYTASQVTNAAATNVGNTFTAAQTVGFVPAAPSYDVGNLVLRPTETLPVIWKWDNSASAWVDLSSYAGGGLGQWEALGDTSDELYIGFASKWTAMDWVIGASNVGVTVRTYGWNGSSWQFMAYSPLTITPSLTSAVKKINQDDVSYAYPFWTAKVMNDHASPPDSTSRYWLRMIYNSGTPVYFLKLAISSDNSAMVLFNGPYTTTQTLSILQNGGMALKSGAALAIESGAVLSNSVNATITSDARFGWGLSNTYPGNSTVGYIGGNSGVAIGRASNDIAMFGTDASVPLAVTTTTVKARQPFSVVIDSAVTNAVVNCSNILLTSTGTPAAGFGAGLKFTLESSTSADQDAGRLTWEWATATHASRAALGKLSAYYTSTERECIRWEADSTAAKVGFLGAAAVARQAHIADPSGGATTDAEARTAINAILNVLENFGLVATS